MKNFLSLFILLFCFLFGNSQSLPCGNGRFISTVFSATTIDSGILFGHNVTYNGVAQDLFMNIYQPTGDVATIRPLIIFAFGGAFISGEREQLGRLCDSIARKGYVTATIDYRRYDGPGGGFDLITNPARAIDAMAKAMSDFKAAIRYFKRDASTTNTYRIDTSSIIIGGVSSGSIAALHTGYINTLAETVPPVSDIIMANGGFEGNTDLPGSPLIGTYTFSGIRGVWNMSGALFDSGYIKTGDPALFGIHGTADPVVPYGYGRFYGIGGYASGSSSLNNQAIKVGVPSSFISVPGGGHDDFYGDTAVVTQIDTTASRFFANILCPTVLAISGGILEGNIVSGQIKLNWQTLSENASKGFEVEKQLPSGWVSLGVINSKAVNGNASVPLIYTFNDLHPQKGANLYRLKIISLNGDVVYSKTIRITWNGNSANVFVIYPNPAGAILQYKTTIEGTGINTIKIYSADMRLMQSNILTAARSVPISGLHNGLYLAIVWDNKNKQVASSWFIKQ